MKNILVVILFVALNLYLSLEIVHQLTQVPVKVQSVELNPDSLYVRKKFTEDHPEVICLAENIFHEARNQSFEGMRAVALVTINRRKHERYPLTICEVVYQPYQFSWTMKKPDIDLSNKIERKAWKQSKEIALNALNGVYVNDMLDVTHYHTTSVKPRWNRSKQLYAQVGDHLFYFFGD